ncbi:hypothetical protein Pta02_14970 [Planobispora takensis]|uniref:Uncharacterized protein n=1 Tax=Planobispora takensis TaxID=1367882 RepID=A0A8J3SRX0_9ACTN|nr:hypothetical protein Pta02_14970 [Planobispora takensis]
MLRGMDFEMATCIETTLPTHPRLPFLSGKRVQAPPAEVAGRPDGLTVAAQGRMVSYTCS